MHPHLEIAPNRIPLEVMIFEPVLSTLENYWSCIERAALALIPWHTGQISFDSPVSFIIHSLVRILRRRLSSV